MLVQILILVVGLALVVCGADYLVDGSSSVARRAGISEFLIGVTIVGIGTSLPELVVSVTGALQGKADIAIGNVVGSNLFNVLLILGLTAIINPVKITHSNLVKDIPLNIAASFLLVLCGMHKTLFGVGHSDTISYLEGTIFLVLFAAYLWSSFKDGKAEEDKEEESPAHETKLFVELLMIVGGIAGLIIGGRLFVNSACKIASMAGLSDKFIAVTILAGGTSLPELVTCIVAAVKKKGQLALGNIIGSNISNIFLILGCSAVCFHKLPNGPSGLAFSGMSMVDLGVFLLSSLLIWSSAFTGRRRNWHRIDRADGVVFISIEIAYMAYLILSI